MVSNPCPPGYGNIFCNPCTAGSYSFDFSSAPCPKCVQLANNAFFSNISEISPFCTYNCLPDIPSESENPQCYSNFDFYVDKLGGFLGVSFVIYAIIVSLVAIILQLTGKVYKYSKNRKVGGSNKSAKGASFRLRNTKSLILSRKSFEQT